MIQNYSQHLQSPRRSHPIVIIVGLLLASTLLASPAGHGQSQTHSLTLRNSSDRTITEFYMSRIGYGFWGMNQLGATPLGPRKTFTRGGVIRDGYDLKYIDRSGRSCIQQNLRIDNDMVIELTNESLAKCESETRR